MKIVHLIGGLGTGGAEAVLAALVLKDCSNEHIVVSMVGEGVFRKELLEAGVKLVDLGMPKRSLSFGGLKKLYRTIKSEQPDVLQTWMYHSDLIGGIVARFAGVKEVSWGIHNSNLSVERTSFNSRLVAKLCALVSKWIPMKIISCAEYAARIHENIGYEKSKIKVVFNGYDLSRFKPSTTSRERIRKSLLIEDSCFLMGMVARWHPVKDHLNLLEALSHFSDEQDWKLVLVGTGINTDNAELVAALEINNLTHRVILLGERRDVPDVINALDLHVLSSAGEAFPNAVAEAMACGVPCVVTNVGDAALIVDGTGVVVEPLDALALSVGIKKMWDYVCENIATETRDEYRAQLHESISSRFGVQAMVDGYNSVWLTMKVKS